MNARIPWKPNSKEQKVIDDKIKENVTVAAEKLGNLMDATALYALHKTFGFGKKRLRRFFDAFDEERRKIEEYYEMDGEADYLCKNQLKKIGVDVEAWNNEKRKRI